MTIIKRTLPLLFAIAFCLTGPVKGSLMDELDQLMSDVCTGKGLPEKYWGKVTDEMLADHDREMREMCSVRVVKVASDGDIPVTMTTEKPVIKVKLKVKPVVKSDEKDHEKSDSANVTVVEKKKPITSPVIRRKKFQGKKDTVTPSRGSFAEVFDRYKKNSAADSREHASNQRLDEIRAKKEIPGVGVRSERESGKSSVRSSQTSDDDGPTITEMDEEDWDGKKDQTSDD